VRGSPHQHWLVGQSTQLATGRISKSVDGYKIFIQL